MPNTTFPSGINPYVFSDTLPAGSTNTISAGVFAQNSDEIHPTIVAGVNTTLTFVVFDYPNCANDAGAPQVPLVEVITQSPTFSPTDPWRRLNSTSGIVGDGSFETSANQAGTTVDTGPIDYTYLPVPGANGVFQITFKFNPGYTGTALDGSSTTWTVRFTINDGAWNAATNPGGTDANHEKGLTFVLDVAGGTASWLALPPQLPAVGGVIDFGSALGAGLTLGPPGGTGSKQLVVGHSYPLTVPVGNYGTALLQVTAATPPSPAPADFSLALGPNPSPPPITVPPGCTNAVSLTAKFAPTAPRLPSAAPSNFTLTTNDPLAGSGATLHPNVLSLAGGAGQFEIVLVLDLSGSMATADAGGMERWAALQTSVGQIMHSFTNFAGPSDTLGVVLYPNSSGTLSGQKLVTPGPITVASATSLATQLAGLTPVDSTPMAGTGQVGTTPANLGGIYMAMGDPGHGPTDCGLFVPSVNTVPFASNYRWMILMSDGWSNVGDDPEMIPATYFTSRNVRAITVGYGIAGAGQYGPQTLMAVAAHSTPANSTAAPGANYWAADPSSGLPSQQLLSQFDKVGIGGVFGLSFAADPDAVLAEGAAQNKHPVIITDYDQRASFVVCFGTVAAANAVQVELITPLGEVVTPSTAASFGLTYSATNMSVTYFASAPTLANAKGSPRHGIWYIVVSRGALAAPTASEVFVNRGGAVAYSYHVGVDSTLSLTVGAAAVDQFAGQPIEIVGALSVSGRPVAKANLAVQVAGTGQGFDNWLASQTVTDAEYAAALKALGGLADIQALFVKTRALAAKGITYPGTPSASSLSLQQDPRTGTYRGTFTNTTSPGTYQFLVTATGQDADGNVYSRQQTWSTVVRVKPDAASTIIDVSYQLVGAQIQATLRFWPRDAYGNVYLVDPAVKKTIEVLVGSGATASGPLTGKLDGSYVQIFTYPPTATPTVSINVAGSPILTKLTPPDFTKLLFVNEVVSYTKGREAKPGANLHTDPSKALGDPSKKPLSSFVSLGGLGMASYDVKSHVIPSKEVFIFVAADTSLRPYAVDVLPEQPGVGWVEIGQSSGGSHAFTLIPAPISVPDTTGWYIEVSGKVAGDTFDVTIPLTGKLHPPVDPLRRIGTKGIAKVRVRDLSNIVVNPDGTPSASPGVSLLGIGFTQ